MKCCACGKKINPSKEFFWVLPTRAGDIYFCKNCHKENPSIEDRIEKLEKENKLVKDILYSILNSLRELEDISDFDLCCLDRDTFKDFYKLEEIINKREEEEC